MQLSQAIMDMIRERSGLDFNSSKAFYSLALDIKEKTGESLGENTLRRLMGVLKDDREPRLHTLDILARYLSMPSWKALQMSLNEQVSRIDACVGVLHSSDLSVGDSIELTWYPDRRVSLEKTGGDLFVVRANENSKLCVGDTLRAGTFAKGFPFLASDVVRGGGG